MKKLIPLAVFFSAAAMAQTSPSFDELDANKDGVLSQQEVTSVSSITFTTADKNGDGYLDTNEYAAASAGSQTTDPSESDR